MTNTLLEMSYLYRYLCKLKLEMQNTKSRKMLLYRQLMDCLVGLVLYLVLKRTIDGLDIDTNFTDFVLLVQDEITKLLQWLMGAPAGLKLNEELSFFLGNVFLYHVNVWVAYVLTIKTFLPQIIQILMMSNILGLGIFFCLINDVISILSVHLHCFYFYASNLYRIQLKSLMTLARLFRGKKWNVLRLRVDSLSYNADQLILGTVLFTILLFLLPTVALYYFVFITIRLLISLLQMFFQWMANSLLNNLQSLVCSNENSIGDGIGVDSKPPETMVDNVQRFLGKILRGDLV